MRFYILGPRIPRSAGVWDIQYQRDSCNSLFWEFPYFGINPGWRLNRSATKAEENRVDDELCRNVSLPAPCIGLGHTKAIGATMKTKIANTTSSASMRYCTETRAKRSHQVCGLDVRHNGLV
jgi:hypothetical protein